MEGEEEGLEGRRWGEAVGNDNVCVAISLWQGPCTLGEDWGATRLQPQCSVGLVPNDPPQTTGSHLCCRQVHTLRKLAMTALYTCWISRKKIK